MPRRLPRVLPQLRAQYNPNITQALCRTAALCRADEAFLTELAREAYGCRIPLKPGARELLERFRQAGEPMALVTACVPDLCRAVLARHGLEPYFERIIFCQELGLEKGSPEVFLRSARLLNAAPEECTLYDDSPSACAAARQAGLTVIGVYDPFYDHCRQEMAAICHQYVTGLESLL